MLAGALFTAPAAVHLGGPGRRTDLASLRPAGRFVVAPTHGKMRQVGELFNFFDQRVAGVVLLLPGLIESTLCAIVILWPYLDEDCSKADAAG
jgi:hypothetical protein